MRVYVAALFPCFEIRTESLFCKGATLKLIHDAARLQGNGTTLSGSVTSRRQVPDNNSHAESKRPLCIGARSVRIACPPAWRPAHPRTLQPLRDQCLARRLHHPRTDGEMPCLRLGMAHAVATVAEVIRHLGDTLVLRLFPATIPARHSIGATARPPAPVPRAMHPHRPRRTRVRRRAAQHPALPPPFHLNERQVHVQTLRRFPTPSRSASANTARSSRSSPLNFSPLTGRTRKALVCSTKRARAWAPRSRPLVQWASVTKTS